MKFIHEYNEEENDIDSPNEEDLISDLYLYIETDYELYKQRFKPAVDNLVKKKKKGMYRPELAQKLFMYMVDDGAKKYGKEEYKNKKWNDIFTIGIRKAVAKEFVDKFEKEYELGNYDKGVTMSESKNNRFKIASLLSVNKEFTNKNTNPKEESILSRLSKKSDAEVIYRINEAQNLDLKKLKKEIQKTTTKFAARQLAIDWQQNG